MKRFDHKNIVKLLGVCTRGEPVYAVMEFMLHGPSVHCLRISDNCNMDFKTFCTELCVIASYVIAAFCSPTANFIMHVVT